MPCHSELTPAVGDANGNGGTACKAGFWADNSFIARFWLCCPKMVHIIIIRRLWVFCVDATAAGHFSTANTDDLVLVRRHDLPKKFAKNYYMSAKKILQKKIQKNYYMSAKKFYKKKSRKFIT